MMVVYQRNLSIVFLPVRGNFGRIYEKSQEENRIVSLVVKY